MTSIAIPYLYEVAHVVLDGRARSLMEHQPALRRPRRGLDGGRHAHLRLQLHVRRDFVS